MLRFLSLCAFSLIIGLTLPTQAAFQLVADEVFEKLDDTVMNSPGVKDCRDSRKNCATIKSKAFFELYQSNTNALINTLNEENLEPGQNTLINLIQKNWLSQLTGKTYSDVLPLQRARLRVIIDLFNAYERDASEEVKAFVWRRLQMANRYPEELDVGAKYLGFVAAHTHINDRYGVTLDPQKLIEYIKYRSLERAVQQDKCRDTPDRFRYASDCPDKDQYEMEMHYRELDANLNAIYKDLKEILGKDEFERLRSIQRNWIKAKKPFESDIGSHVSITKARVHDFLELHNAHVSGLSRQYLSDLMVLLEANTEVLYSGFPPAFRGLSKTDIIPFEQANLKDIAWNKLSNGDGVHPFCIAFETLSSDYWEDASDKAGLTRGRLIRSEFWGNEGFYISKNMQNFRGTRLIRDLENCHEKAPYLFSELEGVQFEETKPGYRYVRLFKNEEAKIGYQNGDLFYPLVSSGYSVDAFISAEGCQKLISSPSKCHGAAVISGDEIETGYLGSEYSGIWGIVEDKAGQIFVMPVKTFQDGDAGIFSTALKSINP